MKEVLLILFGFILGNIPPWFTRKRRLQTHCCPLREDLDQCKEKAETLLRDGVMSPLYRLPLITYEVSFPVLLADGAGNENEILAIGRFFSLVEEMNRGLDYAAEMAGDKQNFNKSSITTALRQKHSLNLEKALRV
jgi:hypothetical protein